MATYCDDDYSVIGDTKEEAIARLKQMQQYQPSLQGREIVVQRDWCPCWLAHALKYTIFDFIAFEKLKESSNG